MVDIDVCVQIFKLIIKYFLAQEDSSTPLPLTNESKLDTIEALLIIMMCVVVLCMIVLVTPFVRKAINNKANLKSRINTDVIAKYKRQKSIAKEVLVEHDQVEITDIEQGMYHRQRSLSIPDVLEKDSATAVQINAFDNPVFTDAELGKYQRQRSIPDVLGQDSTATATLKINTHGS